MGDPFDKAVDAVFSAPGFTQSASYSPVGGGGPLTVPVSIDKEPAGTSFGPVGIATAVITAEVRATDITAAAGGDIFTIGSDTYKVTRADLDADGRIWQLGVQRTS